MTQAYPLKWAQGWPRTPRHEQESGSQFKQQQHDTGERELPTLDKAYRQLCGELRRLGATNVVVSTNYKVGNYGLVESRVRDEGIAVYFQHQNKALAMCCDRYDNAPANLRSLALAIEAMRQLERHGGGTMMDRAFNGFLAITGPSSKKPWREVIGVNADWRGSITDLRALFRTKARQQHPDMGGSDALMAELNAAFAEAKRELRP
jgi:hypothetical protein